MQIIYEIHYSRRRTLSVSITQDCRVFVKAPVGTTESSIRDFLVEKKSWITKHLEKQKSEAQKVKELGYLSEDEIKQIKKQAHKIIPERVEYYSKLSGISYGRIAIRLQRTCWGSCSAGGNLNFNCLLVLMPPEILDSIVVHELCHRRHMNHSKAFYKEIDKYFPDYKRCNKWLKENGGIFLSRVK